MASAAVALAPISDSEETLPQTPSIEFKDTDDPLYGIDCSVRGGTEKPLMVTAAMEAAMHWRYSENNRRLRQARILRAVNRISTGRWVDNGTARIFDKNGYAIQGHHTHAAAMVAFANNPELTYPVNFVWGVDRNTIGTIDTNITRTATDHVRFLGNDFKNDAAVAEATKFLARIYSNTPSAPRKTKATNLTPFLLENDEVENIVFKYRTQLEAADAFVASVKAKVGIRASMLIVLHVWGSGKDEQKTEEFITQVATGLNLLPNSPATKLHEVISSRRRPNQAVTMALAMSMLKRFMAGDVIEKLGPHPRSYPTL